jgi:hypothetical protein
MGDLTADDLLNLTAGQPTAIGIRDADHDGDSIVGHGYCRQATPLLLGRQRT